MLLFFNLSLFLSITSRSSSRKLLFAPHCDPSNPECHQILTTAYHTLVSSIFPSRFPEQGLSIQVFADFLHSMLGSLPSSSATPTSSTNAAALFAEHLLDVLWTIEAQLEEVLAHIDAARSITPPPSYANHLPKALESAQRDKDRFNALVSKLLVGASQVILCSSIHVRLRNMAYCLEICVASD